MEKEFCTIEITKSLEELGFDEECLWYWNIYNHKEPELLEFIDEFSEDYLNAPLWQQAIDWFREKYKLHINILGDGFNGEFKGYYYSITEEGWINWYESIDSGKWYDDYKECQKQAILKAIELCKNN